MEGGLKTMYPEELENREPITSTQGVVLGDIEFDVGEIGARFFKELRDNKKVFGIRCKTCDRVYVPPRFTCRECFNKLEDWVEVGSRGFLVTFTIVYTPVASQPAENPYALGVIKLDGADTGFVHLIGGTDLDRIKVGMRLEVVFKEEREGNIHDIEYFTPA
jgi:uncharacterized OB-fold protein